MNASTLAAWGLAEVLDKYPELRLRPCQDKNTTIAGCLAFSAHTRGHTPVTDKYEVSISVPSNYPKSLPLVRETEGRIPRNFHKLDTGHLCLGSPTRLRLILAETPTLLFFIERCVIPYLYGYSLVESGGTLPFDELQHGPRGLRDDLADLLGADDDNVLHGFVRALTMKKRRANKMPCPCGTGLRVGRCHHRKLNILRQKLGRGWFASLLYGRHFQSRGRTLLNLSERSTAQIDPNRRAFRSSLNDSASVSPDLQAGEIADEQAGITEVQAVAQPSERTSPASLSL